MFLRHTSGEATEARNQQVLGDDSPLEFDEDGYAEVDDDVGEKLLAMHRHVERGGHGPTTQTEDSTDADADVDEDEASEAPEFDVESFVDRTPMSEVVDDIESGDYDAHLDAIEDAEAAGRDRDGVQDAVDARQEE